ncbi:MAG: phosphatidate cytidylyltransferase [Dethiobacter sp.]|nr:phosphatidate cytidylyltransferase [Dethiobacter sp.]MBS3900651.1 phosphatidate cytidylyltransferase [Dethiobacter sp.]MBS3989627.1 phosphatidate cytidylyltransferase [Dethiobacter sp.]
MFWHRLASTLVGIPVVLAVTWMGGLPFFFMALFIGILALRELYNIARLSRRSERLFGYGSHLFLFFSVSFFGMDSYFAGLIFVFLALSIYWLFFYPVDFKNLAVLFWGVFYVTVLLSCILLLRQAPNGFLLVAAALITVWASDTGAYLVGMSIGRRKLMPAVSPAKSFEGAAGGVLFAAVALMLMASSMGYSLWQAAALGVVLSVAGQLGDLAESALKRWGNVKDSGSFLPGHGGVLDRIDSILFVIPVAYFLFVILF